MNKKLLKENIKTSYFGIGLICLVASFIVYISANSLPFTGPGHHSSYGNHEVILEVVMILSLFILSPLLKSFKVNSDFLFAKTIFIIGLYNAIAMISLRIPDFLFILVGILIYALIILPFLLLKFTFKINWIKTIIIGVCHLSLIFVLMIILAIFLGIIGFLQGGWFV